MKFDLTRPCDNCPFRTDVEPYLNRERAEEIAASLIDLEEAFPCHKFTHFEDGEDGGDQYVPRPTDQHCAGALIWMLHQGRPNQLARIAMRLGVFDAARLDMQAPVCRGRREFVQRQPRLGWLGSKRKPAVREQHR